MAKGLFCFDMEGTLLEAEILDELSFRLKIQGISEITSKAMEGQIDFEHALRQRLELLKGATLQDLQQIAQNVPIAQDAISTIQKLKEQGHYTALITGSLDLPAKIIAQRLGVDYWIAHKIESQDSKITGFALAYEDKAEVFRQLKAKIKPDFTVAMGDGANDLGMLREADIGIAFNSKNSLRKNKNLILNNSLSLLDIFCRQDLMIVMDKTVHEQGRTLFSALGKTSVVDLNLEQPKEADIVIIRTKTKADKNFIDKFPNLKIIATATTGRDHIDVDYASSRGILVVDAKGANADSVADYVMRMIMHVSDDVFYSHKLLRLTKDFAGIKSANKRFELASSSIGIIGLGGIGGRVKIRAESFGMSVRAYDPYNPQARHSLQEVMQCDYVSLHCELTDETRGLINKDRLDLMHSQAVLINAARGELIDEQALIDVLKARQIRTAVLDVHQNEPNPSPLYDLAICTPHIAGNSEEAKLGSIRKLFREIVNSYSVEAYETFHTRTSTSK